MTRKRKPIEIRVEERLAISINETADLTSLGVRKVYELIRDGRLEIAKVDKRTLVKVPSVLRLLGVTSNLKVMPPTARRPGRPSKQAAEQKPAA